jgi:hypothetical protein
VGILWRSGHTQMCISLSLGHLIDNEHLFAFQVTGLHCGHPVRSIWAPSRGNLGTLFFFDGTGGV